MKQVMYRLSLCDISIEWFEFQCRANYFRACIAIHFSKIAEFQMERFKFDAILIDAVIIKNFASQLSDPSAMDNIGTKEVEQNSADWTLALMQFLEYISIHTRAKACTL